MAPPGGRLTLGPSAEPILRLLRDRDSAMLHHALTAAAHAEQDGAAEPLILAALLHDIGHALDLDDGSDDDRDVEHAAYGAGWLSLYLPPAVTEPVRLHVEAKRYVCARDPGAIGRLTSRSRASLLLQGGPMDAGECASFERLPGFAAALALRGWDDAPDLPEDALGPLDAYRPLIVRWMAVPRLRHA